MPKVDLPLDQRNIIITRSKEGILDIKKIFISKGANVFDLPAISIADPNDLNPLDEALNQINDFHWIIFSSSNGIKFVDKRLRYFNSSLKECSKKTKIAVVGEKTAKTLEDFGIKADFIPPEFVAESLIDNFPVSGYGLRVFVPRVQTGGRDLIADQVRKAAYRVFEVAAYEPRCPESIPKETIDIISNRKVDAIIFSSGKTVVNAAFLLEKKLGKQWLEYFDQTKFLTIGPQTTKICNKIFGRVDSKAQRYTFEGLLDVAINIFS